MHSKYTLRPRLYCENRASKLARADYRMDGLIHHDSSISQSVLLGRSNCRYRIWPHADAELQTNEGKTTHARGICILRLSNCQQKCVLID